MPVFPPIQFDVLGDRLAWNDIPFCRARSSNCSQNRSRSTWRFANSLIGIFVLSSFGRGSSRGKAVGSFGATSRASSMIPLNLWNQASRWERFRVASGLDGLFTAWKRDSPSVFSNRQWSRIRGSIRVPCASAACSSGGNSFVAMKSDARKSALTSNTATRALSRAFRISSRHSAPGLILVSSQGTTTPCRSSGLRWTRKRASHFASA